MAHAKSEMYPLFRYWQETAGQPARCWNKVANYMGGISTSLLLLSVAENHSGASSEIINTTFYGAGSGALAMVGALGMAGIYTAREHTANLYVPQIENTNLAEIVSTDLKEIAYLANGMSGPFTRDSE